MRANDVTAKRPVAVQQSGILRGRQLWRMSYRDVTSADAAVIGASLEPTAKGVRESLTIYSEILRETKHSFRRIMRELAPTIGFCLALSGGLAVISPLLGLVLAGFSVTASLLNGLFQTESENSSRIFNSANTLQCLFAKLDPSVIRAGLQELKEENPPAYALITDRKALSGEMGRKYGADFIALLRSFEA